jgi:hypothetical protein
VVNCRFARFPTEKVVGCTTAHGRYDIHRPLFMPRWEGITSDFSGDNVGLRSIKDNIQALIQSSISAFTYLSKL